MHLRSHCFQVSRPCLAAWALVHLLWLAALPLGANPPPNSAPTLTVATRIVGLPDRPSLPETVTVADAETDPGQLLVTAEILATARGNARLLKPAGIVFAGSGSARTLVLTPERDEYGFVILRLTVTDAEGGTSGREVRYVVEPFTSALSIGTPPGEHAAWADVDGDGHLDWLWESVWYRNLGGTNFLRAGGSLRRVIAGAALALGDPDGNGSVDFALLGIESNLPRAVVLTNSPAANSLLHRFRPLAEDLAPGYFGDAVAWADIDLDGDVDLFALGSTARRDPGRFASTAWRNDGLLQFVPFDASLPALLSPAMAWTDVEGDGDPDVLVLGQSGTVVNTGVTRLLLNDGTGILTEADVALPALLRGSAAWADFDLDGLPDLFLGGTEAMARGTTNRVRLFRHLPNGQFEEAAELAGADVSSVAIADFTNDGLPDVVYYGALPSPQLALARVYVNRGGWRFDEVVLGDLDTDSPIRMPFALGDMDGDGALDLIAAGKFSRGTASRTNRVPEAPTGLRVTVNEHSALLEWNAARDADQSGGLTYNVRVGRSPGAGDVLSALSRADGTRLVAEPGNAFQSLRRPLRALADGTYYWSVQAVDAALAGGAFAEEAEFVVGAGGDRLSLSIARAANNGLRLTLSARPPGLVVIERSEDLSTWTILGNSEVSNGSATVELSTPDPTGGFFRLRRGP